MPILPDSTVIDQFKVQLSSFGQAWNSGVGGEGVYSSNTPLETSQNTDGKVWGSEDSLVLNLRCKVGCDQGEADGIFAELEAAKVAAQSRKSNTIRFEGSRGSGGMHFELSGQGVSVGGVRGTFMAYVLRGCGVSIYLSGRHLPNSRGHMNARISASSLLLMTYDGAFGVRDFLWFCLESLGVQVLSNTVSRVDPCVELACSMRKVSESYQERAFVSRVHKHASVCEGRDRVETVYFGMSTLRCRIYNKAVEVARDEKKRQIMAARRAGFGNDCVRVEFQLRRAQLRLFGVESLEDWLSLRAGIVAYLTSDWLRITEEIRDRTHTTRAALSPFWRDVQGAFKRAFGEASEVVRREFKTEWMPEDLGKQALGCLVSAYMVESGGLYSDANAFMAWCENFLDRTIDLVDFDAVLDCKSLRYHASDVDIGSYFTPGEACPF